MPTISIRVPRELAEELERRAACEHRSLSSFVRHVLLTVLAEPSR